MTKEKELEDLYEALRARCEEADYHLLAEQDSVRCVNGGRGVLVAYEDGDTESNILGTIYRVAVHFVYIDEDGDPGLSHEESTMVEDEIAEAAARYLVFGYEGTF